jgi:hypothetical protein
MLGKDCINVIQCTQPNVNQINKKEINIRWTDIGLNVDSIMV